MSRNQLLINLHPATHKNVKFFTKQLTHKLGIESQKLSRHHLGLLTLNAERLNTVPKSCPFRWTSWDLILENICTVVNGEGQIYFWSCLNCAKRLQKLCLSIKKIFFQVNKVIFCHKDSDISFSFVLNGSLNYIVLLNICQCTNMAAASAQISLKLAILPSAVVWKDSLSVLQCLRDRL